MDCMERYKKYEQEDFDKIILCIQLGYIKAGKYAGRIKIDKNFKAKGKEFFRNERRHDH